MHATIGTLTVVLTILSQLRATHSSATWKAANLPSDADVSIDVANFSMPAYLYVWTNSMPIPVTRENITSIDHCGDSDESGMLPDHARWSVMRMYLTAPPAPFVPVVNVYPFRSGYRLARNPMWFVCAPTTVTSGGPHTASARSVTSWAWTQLAPDPAYDAVTHPYLSTGIAHDGFYVLTSGACADPLSRRPNHVVYPDSPFHRSCVVCLPGHWGCNCEFNSDNPFDSDATLVPSFFTLLAVALLLFTAPHSLLRSALLPARVQMRINRLVKSGDGRTSSDLESPSSFALLKDHTSLRWEDWVAWTLQWTCALGNALFLAVAIETLLTRTYADESSAIGTVIMATFVFGEQLFIYLVVFLITCRDGRGVSTRGVPSFYNFSFTGSLTEEYDPMWMARSALIVIATILQAAFQVMSLRPGAAQESLAVYVLSFASGIYFFGVLCVLLVLALPWDLSCSCRDRTTPCMSAERHAFGCMGRILEPSGVRKWLAMWLRGCTAFVYTITLAAFVLSVSGVPCASFDGNI